MDTPTIKNITSSQLKQMLETPQNDLSLIDVRTPEEYARGHLKNSLNLPLDQLLEKELLILKDQPIVVYCLSGSRSIMAAQALSSMKYTQVMNLQKGLLEWRFLKYPETN